jgi:hypothetical protein
MFNSTDEAFAALAAAGTPAMHRTGASTNVEALRIEARDAVIDYLSERFLRFCVMCGDDLPDAASLDALTCSSPCRCARKRRVRQRKTAGVSQQVKHQPMAWPSEPAALHGTGMLHQLAAWRAVGFFATWGEQHPATVRAHIIFLRMAKTAAAKRGRGVRLLQRMKIAELLAQLHPAAFRWDERFGRWARIRDAPLGKAPIDQREPCIPIIEEQTP